MSSDEDTSSHTDRVRDRVDSDLARWAIEGAMALGLCLRVIRLGSASLGSHEALNVFVVRHGAAGVSLSPLLLILSRIWTAIGLTGTEWGARSLPLLFGLALVPGMYGLGRALYGVRAGLLAAYITAFSPAFVARSQEFLPGSLVECALVYAAFFLVRSGRTAHWANWPGYALCAAAAFYASPQAMVALAALNLWYLIAFADSRRAAPWLVANAVTAAACIPYVRGLMRAAPWTALAQASESPVAVLAHFVDSAAVGFSATPGAAFGALISFGILVGAGACIAFRREWRTALFPIIVCGVPLLTAAWIASLKVPVSPALLLPLALPLVLWIGVTGASTSPWIRGMGMAFAPLLCLALTVYSQWIAPWYMRSPDMESRYDYRGAARYIAAHYTKGDLIVHADGSSIAPLLYQGIEREGFPNEFVTCRVSDAYDPMLSTMANLGPAYGGPRQATEIDTAIRPYARVWYVFSAEDRRRLAGRPLAVKEWMDAHWFETDHQVFPGVELLLYEHKIAGHWTRLEGRDADDGASSALTYWFGLERSYPQFQVDAGLVPRPLEARRGRLKLAFDPEPTGGVVIPLAHGSAMRERGFTLRNASNETVRARVRIAATARLLDMASMKAQQPESEIWQLEPMRTGTPSPEAWPLPSMRATLHKGGDVESTMNGGIHLDAGEYYMYLFQYVTTLPSNTDRATLSLTVGDKLVYRSVSNFPGEAGGWSWTFAGAYGLPLKDDLVHVNATAALPSALPRATTECAYLAFVPRNPDSPSAEAKQCFWEDTITIGPGETERWRVHVNESSKRVDVWAQELDDRGIAYRIFRTFD